MKLAWKFPLRALLITGLFAALVVLLNWITTTGDFVLSSWLVDIARRVHTALGCPAPILDRPAPRCPDDPQRRCPDLRRLRELGWTQQVPLEEGVRLTARWMLGQATLAT